MGANGPLELRVIRDHTPGRVKTTEVEDLVGNRYALKSYGSDGPEHYQTALRTFRKEMGVLQGIDPHRCIATIEEVAEGHYVRQWMPGRSLRDWISKDPVHRFSQEEVLYIGSEVLDALEHVRKYGITHADIKPENITYDKDIDGKPVGLLDFGVARIHSATTDFEVMDGTTLAYMAPEEYMGHVDHRTDLFCLGSTLVEILTGRQLSDYMQGENIDKLRIELPNTIDANMQTLLYGLLAINPDQRYQTAGQARADFERLIAGEAPIGAQKSRALVRRANAGLTETPDRITLTKHTHPSGELTRLQNGDQIAEHLQAEGVYLRIYTTDDGTYTGVLHQPNLRNNAKDAQTFASLTEIIAETTGDTVANSSRDYATYVSNDGLEVRLSEGNGTLRINREDDIKVNLGFLYGKKDPNIISLMEKGLTRSGLGFCTEKYLHNKSRLFGIATSVLTMTSIPLLYSSILPVEAHFVAYSMLVGAIDASIATLLWGEGVWNNGAARISPSTYAMSYLPVKTLHKRRLLTSDHLLHETAKTSAKLENLKTNNGSERKIRRLTKKLDLLTGAISEVFPQTQHRKGLTLTYEGSREEVVDFFTNFVGEID